MFTNGRALVIRIFRWPGTGRTVPPAIMMGTASSPSRVLVGDLRKTNDVF